MFRVFVALLCCSAGLLTAQDGEDEWQILLASAQRKFDQGNLTSAENDFVEIADAYSEEPEATRPRPAVHLAAQAGLLTIDLRRGRYDRLIESPGELDEDIASSTPVLGLRARALLAVGRHEEAQSLWRRRLAADPADMEARYELGVVLHADGRRAAARQVWQELVAMPTPSRAEDLLWRARSRWRLGGAEHVVAASQELVTALSSHPGLHQARTTLGILRFEVYGEASGFPSGEKALLAVLDEHGDIEEALLALYRLRSSNMLLDGGKTEGYLDRALQQNPRSVEALVLRAETVLNDRRFLDAAALLDDALRINPNHRLALCHRAAAAWVLGQTTRYEELRERASAGDEPIVDAERVLADHLVALYRFGDAIPFYEAARKIAPEDTETLQGLAKALVYTGRGPEAKQLLLQARATEAGYVDPWRNNMIAVEELLEEDYDTAANDRFRLRVHREDEEVLLEYLMPLALEAFDTLGAKYSYRPDRPVTVDVLHTWDDFSVRTIGFRGFTALGACFGPYITLVSPRDVDLRKQDFMWEATVWHEYVHVLTLGLSRHRVPRWLTEGFSVYEERMRDAAWERGMDRELFDAFHNRDIPPVRLLNRLFRGQRILFGYYQGGLIVEWIARERGFDRGLELLRAFGDDLDTEAAFERALGMSSREFDRQFLRFVEEEKLKGMRLVPRHDDAAIQRLLVAIARSPDDLRARLDLAWAFVQRNNPVDAGPHLAAVLRQNPEHPEAMLIRAELLRRRNDLAGAIDHWRRGFAGGADDFDSRVQFGRTLMSEGDEDGAEEQWQKAKACWPSCTEQDKAPELLLAALYRQTGRRDQALMEMKAYCRRTARAYEPRWMLAEFERESGNREAEAKYLEECNQIDPFRRQLHVLLGEAYEALGRQVMAAREYRMAAAVLPQVDREYLAEGVERPAADDPGERETRAGLLVRSAELLWGAGQTEKARELLRRVQTSAASTDAAQRADELLKEWG
jgi:tetratricopeptide (TPR) repeat protein